MAPKVTYKQAVLITRLSNGDWSAAEELWGTLTTVPFNPDQPLEDLVAELTLMIGALDITPETPKAKPEPSATDVVKQVGEIWTAVYEQIRKTNAEAHRQPGTRTL
jgi:hypothetical protein